MTFTRCGATAASRGQGSQKREKNGGAGGTRTRDLFHAKETRSQLRHSPTVHPYYTLTCPGRQYPSCAQSPPPVPSLRAAATRNPGCPTQELAPREGKFRMLQPSLCVGSPVWLGDGD